MTQLFKLKRNQKFKLVDVEDVKCPPSAATPVDSVYTYKYVDGMYAPVQDEEGNFYYFAAWTEVEPLEAA